MTGTAGITLRLDAPFSAWRWLQAGVYRGTFPVIPPSAAWGLVLNVAGIETRGSLNDVATTIRSDAPALEIAVGVIRFGQRGSLYQQLHSYPVGASGKELKPRTRGNKYWIAPARREVLVDQIAIVGARGPRELIERIPMGLAGTLDVQRYGLPFAGDNQFLFNDIKIVSDDEPAFWYQRVTTPEVIQGTTRLTTNIDRRDASRTEAPLFAPAPWGPCPSGAWLRIGPVTPAAS